jgi:hypothetical protein
MKEEKCRGGIESEDLRMSRLYFRAKFENGISDYLKNHSVDEVLY